MKLRRIKIWINTIVDFLCSFSGCKAKIIDDNETIEYSIENKKNIIRFGDGEFNILIGKSIRYQKYEEKLRKELESIVNDYDKQKYILCVPKYFFECTGFKLAKKRVYVSSWATSRRYFKEHFKQSNIYGDAFAFKKDNVNIYEKLWKNQNFSKCIFVHNNIKYAEEFSKRYKINTKYIYVPSENAYECIDYVFNEIQIEIKDKKNTIVLVSAGPMAKCLIKRLAEQNIYAIDTGHCWDEPLVI